MYLTVWILVFCEGYNSWCKFELDTFTPWFSDVFKTVEKIAQPLMAGNEQ